MEEHTAIVGLPSDPRRLWFPLVSIVSGELSFHDSSVALRYLARVLADTSRRYVAVSENVRAHFLISTYLFYEHQRPALLS
jgi:hypothetical protein